jgi:hypothetical protein
MVSLTLLPHYLWLDGPQSYPGRDDDEKYLSLLGRESCSSRFQLATSLGCKAVYSDRSPATFWRNILPPSSGSKGKARNLQEVGGRLKYTAS